MDLSQEISSALRLLGDSTKTEYAIYQEVLRKVTEDFKKGSKTATSPPEVNDSDAGEDLPRFFNFIQLLVKASFHRLLSLCGI